MSEETISMNEQPNEIADQSGSAFSRRRFLVGAGVGVGLAVVAAACGNEDEGGSGAGGGTSGMGGGQASAGDVKVAALAAALEALAVKVYQDTLNAAPKLQGGVPPAGAEFVKTALAHHQEYLKSWNDVLKKAGQPEVTAPDNPALQPTVSSVTNAFAQVKDFAGAAELAEQLEKTASATYLNAIPSLQSKDAIRQAAEIQAVTAKRVAILLYVLGSAGPPPPPNTEVKTPRGYPVPATFAMVDKAIKPA